MQISDRRQALDRRQVLDRRLRSRFRVKVPFSLKNSSQEVAGTTRNISILGISAFTNAPIDMTQPVQCILKLPAGDHPVTVSGTIIRCEQLPESQPEGSYEIGVFFKEFQDRGDVALQRFLQQVGSEEEQAIKAGYIVLKQRLAARRRRKRLETLRKRRRQLARMRRKRLAEKKRSAPKGRSKEKRPRTTPSGPKAPEQGS